MSNKKPTLAIMDVDGLIFYAGWDLRTQLTGFGQIHFRKKLDSLIKSILNRVKADYFIRFNGSKPVAKSTT